MKTVKDLMDELAGIIKNNPVAKDYPVMIHSSDFENGGAFTGVRHEKKYDDTSRNYYTGGHPFDYEPDVTDVITIMSD